MNETHRNITECRVLMKRENLEGEKEILKKYLNIFESQILYDFEINSENSRENIFLNPIFLKFFGCNEKLAYFTDVKYYFATLYTFAI